MPDKHGKDGTPGSVRQGGEPERKSSPLQPGDLFKNLAAAVGTMGSLAAGLAVLFFWLGNAIVVSRLRVYNLYGLVNYTDDYVKEAGYQFLRDVFTCFGITTPIIVTLAGLGFIIYNLPLGPFPGRIIPPERNHGIRTRVWTLLRYAILPVLSAIAVLGLVAPYPLTRNINEILEQEILIDRIFQKIKEKPLKFVERQETRRNKRTALEDSFYHSLTVPPENAGIAVGDELCQNLNKLKYPCKPKETEVADLRKTLDTFRKNYGLREGLPENFDAQVRQSESMAEEYKGLRFDYASEPRSVSDAKRAWEIDVARRKMEELDTKHRSLVKSLRESEVYRALRSNAELNDVLREQIKETLDSITLISGLLKGRPPDNSVLMVIASHHRAVGSSLQKLKSVQEIVDSVFDPASDDSRSVMQDLKRVHSSVRLGRVRLSYAFWILVGLIIYFVLNIPRVLRFRQQEVAYFIVMLVMLLVLAEIVPTTYGRYHFEFKIQRLQNICFSDKDKSCDENHPIKADLREALRWKKLYILMGPTKGKEVILGTVNAEQGGALRIVMLDREIVKYMEAIPVDESESLEISKALIRTRPSVRRLND